MRDAGRLRDRQQEQAGGLPRAHRDQQDGAGSEHQRVQLSARSLVRSCRPFSSVAAGARGGTDTDSPRAASTRPASVITNWNLLISFASPRRRSSRPDAQLPAQGARLDDVPFRARSNRTRSAVSSRSKSSVTGLRPRNARRAARAAAATMTPKLSSKWRRPRALMFSSTAKLRAGGLLSNRSHQRFQNFCRSKSASRVKCVAGRRERLACARCGTRAFRASRARSGTRCRLSRPAHRARRDSRDARRCCARS